MLRVFSSLLIFALLPFGFIQAQLNNHPDHIKTENGELIIHPILHGTIVFEWNGLNIYVDPYGSKDLYEGKADPDLILITHPHGDHLNLETLNSLNTEGATFIVPQAVADEIPEKYSGQVLVMGNGESMERNSIQIEAIPMYNLPEEGARHAKGWGNGYVLTIGEKNIYVSGDTEDIPEMRNLSGIDIAFICMNLPYTMDINQAADAVLDFEPSIIYPYHHRGQDMHEFKKLVDKGNKDIEVRLKDWYPGQ
ncbi:MAG: MBL fold metallo-hydrolase [Gracilimonas sp.]|uniref:MBL fold metallo-hydrolase n=1 Tax=Gracilimonas sp. TaxID=1974203 RepID=UPI0019AD1F27|nr:MBL fold metallo-hydrolase [Gracilimonas sp.]MBD3615108.1 MBL fold metallo-hydrolase [Gracilimonas sp.]